MSKSQCASNCANTNIIQSRNSPQILSQKDTNIYICKKTRRVHLWPSKVWFSRDDKGKGHQISIRLMTEAGPPSLRIKKDKMCGFLHMPCHCAVIRKVLLQQYAWLQTYSLPKGNVWYICVWVGSLIFISLCIVERSKGETIGTKLMFS